MSKWTQARTAARLFGQIAGLFGWKVKGVPLATIEKQAEAAVAAVKRERAKPKAKAVRNSTGE